MKTGHLIKFWSINVDILRTFSYRESRREKKRYEARIFINLANDRLKNAKYKNLCRINLNTASFLKPSTKLISLLSNDQNNFKDSKRPCVPQHVPQVSIVCLISATIWHDSHAYGTKASWIIIFFISQGIQTPKKNG